MRRNNLLRTEQTGDIVGSQSVGGFYLTEKIYPPGIKLPMHYHQHACFCLVLEGTYTELYRGKTIECKPSRLIFRPAEELHADHIGNRAARCFLIEPGTEWLASLHKYSIPLSEPEGFQSHSLVWLMMRLRNESQRADDFTSLTMEGLMLELIAEVARGSKRVCTHEHPRWLKRAREILHENFSERTTLASIAEAVGVHPVYLACVFRQHYHCSVGEYVRRLRIEFASRELSRTDSPLADIALAAGFAHQPHFSRTFKRLTGLTPAQYRSTFRQP